MHPKKILPLLALALSVTAIAPMRAAEGKSAVPFRPIAFDAACAAAKTEGKLILIDFYTTWCEPCKRLDKDTWTDVGVGKLVGDKAIPLKLDAEKEGREQAKRYKINAYPTLLLLKADGTEMDRIVGYRDPVKFTEEFSGGVAGKPALARAADAVAAVPAEGHDAVQARYNYAKTLAQNGKNAEALDEYLWCYDVGMVKETSFSGVRGSFLVASIADLGRSYRPALAALRERRDEAERTMLRDEAGFSAAMDFASLNNALKEDDRTLQAFEQMPTGDRRRQGLLTRVYDLLLKEQRYADAAEAMPLPEMEKRLDRDIESMKRMAARPRPAGREDPFPDYVVRSTAKNIEVLVGVGKLDSARDLAEKLFAQVSRTDATRSLLHDAAARAGHPELWADATAKP